MQWPPVTTNRHQQKERLLSKSQVLSSQDLENQASAPLEGPKGSLWPFGVRAGDLERRLELEKAGGGGDWLESQRRDSPANMALGRRALCAR